MDLLAQLFASGTPGPADGWWYQPVGIMTPSGIKVDPDGAKKISAWYRGRDLLATSVAMLPLKLMQITSSGSEPAENHPLYDVLQRKPNLGEDQFKWRRQQMYDLIDHGHGYSWRDLTFSWSLDRIDPALVTTEKIKKGQFRGRTLFHVKDEQTGQTTVHTQDEVFHLEGAEGKGILERARESLGLAAVTEHYASNIFSNGTLNGGVIKTPGPMKDEQMTSMARSFVTAVGQWHMPRILPMGADWVPNDLSPEKAQLLLSRKFTINEMARWLGLPPHMLGDLDRATFSNIEHQGQEFVTFSLGGWLSLIEGAGNDQLILQPNKFFMEFTRDALVRGDIATRWQAYQMAVSTGVYTRNEVRELENMNPLPGLDTPLDPAFLTGNKPEKAPSTPPSQSSRSHRAEAIVEESSARVLRKEKLQIEKAAVKYASDAAAFETWARAFYGSHHELVEQTMLVSEDVAKGYCAIQLTELLEDGVSAAQGWGPEYLAGLALSMPKPQPPPPAPHIEVHSPVTIADGAVTTPDVTVHAPVTVQPASVNVEPGVVTIEKGAIQHDTHVTLPAQTSKVVKKVKRDAKNQIAEVIEEHS